MTSLIKTEDILHVLAVHSIYIAIFKVDHDVETFENNASNVS